MYGLSWARKYHLELNQITLKKYWGTMSDTGLDMCMLKIPEQWTKLFGKVTGIFLRRIPVWNSSEQNTKTWDTKKENTYKMKTLLVTLFQHLIHSYNLSYTRTPSRLIHTPQSFWSKTSTPQNSFYIHSSPRHSKHPQKDPQPHTPSSSRKILFYFWTALWLQHQSNQSANPTPTFHFRKTGPW